MTKELQEKRKQKQVYLPPAVCLLVEEYRLKNHVFSDNQAIINLVIEGARSLGIMEKENAKN